MLCVWSEETIWKARNQGTGGGVFSITFYFFNLAIWWKNIFKLFFTSREFCYIKSNNVELYNNELMNQIKDYQLKG